MRRVTVFGVTPGMRLARSIRGSKGEMLLAAGMSLSETHVRILRDRGVFLLDVEDGLTDDIEIEETIPEDLRQRGVKAVQNVHTLLAQAAENMDSSTEESLRNSLQTASFARSTKDQSTVHALADAAIAIVDNILNSEAVLGLSSIRLYDQYTFQHSVSTAVAGVVIGRNLGWQRQQLCDLATGCLMHDIGKIFIDREVLNKPGRLTEDETRIVQEHAKLGYETEIGRAHV